MKAKELFFSTMRNLWGAVSACLLLCLTVSAVEPPEITVPYALLVDARYGEVLYEKNAHELTYPASTTKVMTALLIIEAIERGEMSLDQMVTASELAEEGLSIYGSSQGIDTGEIMSVRDLLYCLLLASANEAGNILAIELVGSLDTFVARMNFKAADLGCSQTNFMNTHGLHDDNHYTTAYDLYLIFKEAMKHSIFAEITGSAVYTTAATNHEEERLFYNTNGLLSEWYYKGYAYEHCIGGKTGSTPEAGRCLVSAAEYGNEYVIAVVLGATPVILDDGSTLLPQMAESHDLLKHGIDDFERRVITPGAEPVGQVVVTMSEETDVVMVRALGEVAKTLPVDMNLKDVKTEVTLFVETAEAPIAAGTKMGEMVLSYEGEIYGVLDVVTVYDVSLSEWLYKKRAVEDFVGKYGPTMVCVALAGGIGAAGVVYTMEQRKRRHSWRSNQKTYRRRRR